MAQDFDSVADVRAAFARGELDPQELEDALASTDEETDRDELWARWASQGLFDEPVEQEGYTSFKSGIPREVEGDG